MGASLVYLDSPNKEVEFETGENDRLKFAAGQMQGWRLNMVTDVLILRKMRILRNSILKKKAVYLCLGCSTATEARR